MAAAPIQAQAVPNVGLAGQEPIETLLSTFEAVGAVPIAGAPLCEGVNRFPDTLKLLVRGRKPMGSEPAIIASYMAVVQHLNVLHQQSQASPNL